MAAASPKPEVLAVQDVRSVPKLGILAWSFVGVVAATVIGVASLLLGLPLVFTIVVANFIGGYIPYIGAFSVAGWS